MGACNSTKERKIEKRENNNNKKQDSVETTTKVNEVNSNINSKNITEFIPYIEDKKNNNIKNNINEIKEQNQNENNDIDINEKKEENKKEDKKEEYNKESNYYLICPICSERSPHIEELYYDDKSKDFIVKFTCICFENTNYSKETKFLEILSNKEPLNICSIHPGNKLIIFCKDCHKAICNICQDEIHNNHNFEDNLNNNISKENADNMLKLIKQKEEQFNIEICRNEDKIENGIDNIIQKLNKEKKNYKRELEKYKDKNQKTFGFLRNLYGRYINNFEEKNNIGQNDSNKDDNIINNDIMLNNHINKFAIDNNILKFNSNLDEIIKKYNNDEKKELKLNYDYGFHNRNSIQINSENIGKIQSSKYQINDVNSNSKIGFSCVKTLEEHTEKIVSLIELSSGQLVSGSYDNTIIIWNINTSSKDKIINEKGRVFALLEFENNMILAGTSENVINLWDISSEDYTNNLFSFTGHELWVNCLAKINNFYFASASNDSKIKIWDFQKREFIRNLEGHKDCILSLILLKNNNLCSGSADLTIKIWDWGNGNTLKSLEGHEKWVKSVFELDNGIILSGSDDKTIKLWKDYSNILTLEEHEHAVRTFCQINKKYFVSGSFDCTIKIWDINTWNCVQTLYGHNSNIICIISLNKQNNKSYKFKEIASCSNDKTIKIWEAILL